MNEHQYSWMIFICNILIICIKILMIPLYYSTDFDVHRNWLSITYTLPISQWYINNTCQWTLDYPPLFAWFQYFWSLIASIVDPQALIVVSNYEFSQRTLWFQRLSTICSDLILVYAVIRASNWLRRRQHSSGCVYVLNCVLCVANPGLLIVDHIHFQYNGFLFGVFILSMVAVLERRPFAAAAYFAVLLNLKHIFLYVAPVYFVYLLRAVCFERNGKGLRNFIALGVIVLFVFAVSLGPFVYLKQIPQLLSRLFPFKRGLTHAYWAPNVWSLYNALDLVLSRAFPSLAVSVPTYTSGFVTDTVYAVLPKILPLYTMVLTLTTMAPALIGLWRVPRPRVFMTSLIFCSMCSFMCGWHVHEKAILIALIPLCLWSSQGHHEAKAFFWINIVGNYALFPLLFGWQEGPIKVLLLIIHVVFAQRLLHTSLSFNAVEKAYLLGFIPVHIATTIVHPLFLSRFKFLPLLITSVYCGVGSVAAWYYCWVMHTHTVQVESKV